MVDYALNQLHVDNLGLDYDDRKYLKFILENYQEGPVGIETFSRGLAETKDTIEDTIEPYMVQIGLISRTPKGRILCEKCLPASCKHPKLTLVDLWGG